MCGRYASVRKRQELLDEFFIERDQVIDDLDPDYNVAPTKPVYAVLTRGLRGSAAAAGEGAAGTAAPGGKSGKDVARELRAVRWGLVPSWAKDPAIGSRIINARVETVDAKPSFRSAFAKRRCLLPADGFYEWLKVEEQGKTRKQPYYIHRADDRPLAFAGLYELWRDPSAPGDHPQAWLWTAVIITTQAEDEVGRIHDRMPMVIDPAGWDDWLDPANNDAAAVRGLLKPASASGLASYLVGKDVNYVRNNGPDLIKPLNPADGHGAGAGTGTRGPRSGPMPDRPEPSAVAAGEPARTRHRHRHSDSAPLSLF